MVTIRSTVTIFNNFLNFISNRTKLKEISCFLIIFSRNYLYLRRVSSRKNKRPMNDLDILIFVVIDFGILERTYTENEILALRSINTCCLPVECQLQPLIQISFPRTSRSPVCISLSPHSCSRSSLSLSASAYRRSQMFIHMSRQNECIS